MTRTQRFFARLKTERVAFIGVGVSHNELIRQLLQKGIRVLICDKKDDEQFDMALKAEFSAKGADFALGAGYLEAAAQCGVIFRSPGVYFNEPVLVKARENGAVVTSETEVFFDLCPCKSYGVTGSDGKTTTTTLIAEILRADGRRVHLGGNIGKALLPIVETMAETDCAVAELSSFQLMSMRRSPDVAILTNITPNHLDVHGTMEEYIAAKRNILDHQTAFSRAVINADNAAAAALAGQVRGKLMTFSRREMPAHGAFLRADGMLCAAENGTVTEVFHKDLLKIPGLHNVENFLAAIAALWGEVAPEAFAAVAEKFRGVEHRIELVREKDGVRWYNDSIATSPTRVLAGLHAFDEKLVVIAGGYDKKIPFAPMAAAVCARVKTLILIGDAADEIERAVRECPDFAASGLNILRAAGMESAVHKAYKLSEAGDVVTLSPACASFDKYENFEARGRHFKELVAEL
ncbi:MAG: UDP-N-acetylmuramoyl-L-alanine--D-glutamate ligase [Oscillospiraceae bacterium]